MEPSYAQEVPICWTSTESAKLWLYWRKARELKRRSSVIGIFPNEESLVRTMGAVLIEESHQRQSGRALFSPKTFKEFMTPEVIKTPDRNRERAATKLHPQQWTERFAHTPKIGQCM